MTKIKIEENKRFKDLTTFRVGGLVKYYVEVKNNEEVEDAICFAKTNKLNIFVLGGGSDILVSDNDFDGIVIKFTGDKIEIDGETIKAEAGANWDYLVETAIKNNLQGIECLSGIPGTVGASPIQNIGAYGQEIKNTFVSLAAYDIEKEKFVVFDKDDCEFDYRESIFKKKEYWQKYVITEVTLKLKKGANPEVKYDSLIKFLDENKIKNPTLAEIRKSVLTIRAGKFENPSEVGNAGSFFKNPTLTKTKFEELSKEYPNIPVRENGNGTFKGSAGWFIEMAGWKGKTYKEAGVSGRHALILINPNSKAKAEDVMELSEKIIEDVDKKFGIKLEREVQLINF